MLSYRADLSAMIGLRIAALIANQAPEGVAAA